MGLFISIVAILVGIVALSVFVAVSEAAKHTRKAAVAAQEGRAYTQDAPLMDVDYSGDVITYGNPNGSAFGNAAWKVVGPVFEPIVDSIMGANRKR